MTEFQDFTRFLPNVAVGGTKFIKKFPTKKPQKSWQILEQNPPT